MLRLLELLTRGHIHEWEIIDRQPLKWSNDFGEGTSIHFYLRCKKCGWVRKVYCE